MTHIIRCILNKREFRVEDEYDYDRSGAVRWILSHLWRYPLLPIVVIITAVINNFAASYVQVFVGQAFDLIAQPEWETAVLLSIALGAFAAISGQSILGILRNYSNEFIASRIERDARDELYINLLGKSQTFHGRQRIGDIMARATNDVRTLNMMFSPGLMLIIDSFMGIIAPITLIAFLNIRLLLVPGLFLIAFVITVAGYSRQLNPVSLKIRAQFGQMNAGLAETIAGIEVVKGNAQEQQEQQKFVTDAAGYRDYFIQQGIIQARYLPMLMFSLAWGAAFFHAMIVWRQGIITLGEVVAYMGLVGVLRFPTFISIFSFNLVQFPVNA
jgi:ATP-binding cassette subfamily B protein